MQGRTIWISPEPTSTEVNDLSRRFPEVVEVPVEGLRERLEFWAATAVVAWSLGRWVSPEMLAQEFRLRTGIKGTEAAYGLNRGSSFSGSVLLRTVI